MTGTTESPAAGRSHRARTTLIDCDVHNAVPSDAALIPYLSARWRRHLELVGSRTFSPFTTGYAYPKAAPFASRHDAWPPGGALPGSDLDFMRAQLLDAYDIEFAVLNCLYRAPEQRYDAYAAALAAAVNDWQVEHWLSRDRRLRASITVSFESPELAAAEIHRAAADPGFVQVLLYPRTRDPLGRRAYWPIFEAAAETGLPVGLHAASTTPGPITSAGWPSYYIEDHTSLAVAFQAQVTSLIFEGVFDRFPDLQVVLMEGGFAWVPGLMARLDGLHRRLGAEVPDLVHPPSHYLRHRIRITTQPMEEPEDPADLIPLIRDVGQDVLMFSTDYPHWDFDDPHRAFQTRVPSDLHRRIMYDNARRHYRFTT
ncbi:amidohydrolase family protein [Pseudonocardia acidicola]|uniref:Amidohydrolase n=1 Tax=Pseudonocardia acidicola TaxID=2724939 RepID=A0ABX1S449_9PSEU|nr:amidohydrolase family protein [Pseudonocardia acidicola]NMH96369.1 amidohydrolase [Pseudonocardia acidicola]